MSDTTAVQAIKTIVSPTMGVYNEQMTWVLDSTTMLPIGVKHEIIIPATVQNPGN